MDEIEYRVSPRLTHQALNALLSASWPEHREVSFTQVLARSLLYVAAYAGSQLVGFVNVAWDGGSHAFLLDTTVDPSFRQRGIGRELVRIAATETARRGVEWLHVDYEPRYASFYEGCGFRPTAAGLMRLSD